MKRLYKLVGACFSAALLAACAGGIRGLTSSAPDSGLPPSFGSQQSHQVLAKVGVTLYGTTFGGGSLNLGTVYSITPSGTETVLHNFAGGHHDGAYPDANLINVGGTLYGTTYKGGSHLEGTVYSITPSGKETVLHSFAGGANDGYYPQAGLTSVGGKLYGTTTSGGSKGKGTVYSITPSGTETVLHNFAGGPHDGELPIAGLTNVGGTLYGTTYYGGHAGWRIRDGTVYSITPSGKETVLHNFTPVPHNGAFPIAGLTNVGRTLYGTTTSGGSNKEKGTVFKIATDGKYTQLHAFLGINDGSFPGAGLTNVSGTLYGTTELGGSQNDGTVFKITTDGAYTQLYAFVGGVNDGRIPEAALTNVGGTLYGTTAFGASQNDGTVFKIATNGAYIQLYSFAGGSNDGANPYAALTQGPR